MRGLVVLFLLSSCGFPSLPSLGSSDAHGGTDGNTGSDGSMATADAQQCFGTGVYTVCLAALPTLAVTISDGAILDTATSTSCLPAQPAGWTTGGQPAACFVVGTNLTVSNVRVIGSRPLVLVATNQLTITGTVDGASHLSPFGTGPGVPFSGCPTFLSAPADGTSGAGGGAGATFITRGGNGGVGNASSAVAGGTSPLAETTGPTRLRPGCVGQNGGTGSTNGGLGGGGLAGGVIYLVAGSTISLGPNAILNVSGSGGSGGHTRAGGGGGGSGGMLVLYAPTISAMGAKLVANGGAGGTGGAGSSTSSPSGSDPTGTSPSTPAAGVAGATGTGTGGSGYASSSAAQSGANGAASFGGGGGGGGGGFIQSNVALTGAVASPAVSVQ
jgi:hypothetical protein